MTAYAVAPGLTIRIDRRNGNVRFGSQAAYRYVISWATAIAVSRRSFSFLLNYCSRPGAALYLMWVAFPRINHFHAYPCIKTTAHDPIETSNNNATVILCLFTTDA